MRFLLSSWLRRLAPLLTVVLTMIVALALSTRLPQTAFFIPLLPLHYWSVPHPLFMPSWLVFAIGILQDLLVATPLGLHAFLWLAFYACVRLTAFAVQEGRIAVLTLHYILLSCVVPLSLVALLLLHGRAPSGSWEALWGWGCAAVAYPFVALLLRKMERSLLVS